MKPEMFVMEIKPQNEVSTIRNKYFDLIEEINTTLQQQNYSTAELYQIMIYQRIVKPTFFREFEKIIRWGVRQGLINPNMLVSKRIKGRRLPNFFKKEQITKFFKNCEDPRTATTSFLSFWCGLRPSEVTKLRVNDIDFEGERIKIIQSKGSKDRIVPFLKQGHEIIKKWIRYSNATDYLFPSNESHSAATENQNHISQKTMTDGFRKTLEKAGLNETDDRYKKQNSPKKKYTFYVWRHTFATYWINKGISPAFIKEAMGHAKMDTTINVYSHIENGNIVGAMKELKQEKIEVKPAVQIQQSNDKYTIIAERFMKGEITSQQAAEMKKFIASELN